MGLPRSVRAADASGAKVLLLLPLTLRPADAGLAIGLGALCAKIPIKIETMMMLRRARSARIYRFVHRRGDVNPLRIKRKSHARITNMIHLHFIMKIICGADNQRMKIEAGDGMAALGQKLSTSTMGVRGEYGSRRASVSTIML